MQDALNITGRAMNTILPHRTAYLGNWLFYSCTVKGYNTGLQDNFHA